MDEAVSVFFVELIAALNAFLEGFFESPPVLRTNGLTHGMKMRFDETIQVVSELWPESSAYSEEGDDLVELVLCKLPVERPRGVVEDMIPFSNLLHQVGHSVLSFRQLFEA